MPRKPEYNTQTERAALWKRMWEVADMDSANFALLQLTSADQRTQYRTTNSMVKKRPKKDGTLSTDLRMVEAKIDLRFALLEGDFSEAFRNYITIERFMSA